MDNEHLEVLTVRSPSGGELDVTVRGGAPWSRRARRRLDVSVYGLRSRRRQGHGGLRLTCLGCSPPLRPLTPARSAVADRRRDADREDEPMEGILYLLHLERPLGDPSRPHMSAQHYLGFTAEDDVTERLSRHAAGAGSRMLAAAVGAGIGWRLVWIRAGDRHLERRLKNAGHFAERLCDCRQPCSSTRKGRR
ncbi:MAG TPA: hypothetical protein VMD59_14250 [Acidimicrobiales bacterium]|nr:hypothetical protein [Acidimicrobiales bacterium]